MKVRASQLRPLAKKGKAGDDECVRCHVTGLSLPDGYRRSNERPELAQVSCESCHGPASGWLSSHYAVGGTHANNVSRGLTPLENPRVRAGVCLDCHFGSADEGQFVTHRIMAAGHPRISFELDLFTTLQQHHNEDSDYAARKGHTDNLRMWAIGQAMALDRSLGWAALSGEPMLRASRPTSSKINSRTACSGSPMSACSIASRSRPTRFNLANKTNFVGDFAHHFRWCARLS